MSKLIVAMVVGIAVAFAGSAQALVLGQNITIPDLVGSGAGWAGAQEDQEVEPYCVQGQQWDLEGFFLNGSTLSMVGGYDFQNGQEGYTSGDIFIDTDGNLNYGPGAAGSGSGNSVVNNNLFGYEYVLDLDMASLTYNVYALNDSSLLSVYFEQNDDSNPWRYITDGSEVAIQSGSIGYLTGLSDADVGLLGGNHNAVSVDLAFLPVGTDFISHFTLGCGNDNLMGSTVPDGGVTAMLLGLAMLSVEGIRRRLRK